MAKQKLPPTYPDFLLIGAPEAGGDIIKKMLLRNPKVWFPPLDNILAFHPGFQLERLQIAHDIFKGIIPFQEINQPFWLLKYFLQPSPTNKWYSKLFRTKQEGLFKGELSDEYVTLPFDQTERLSRLLPDCKIVLMIRHPVDRSFASIRKKFKENKKTPFASLTKRQMVALMNSDWARTHSSYQHALDCWPIFFSTNDIFIGFYDDLISDPVTFMSRLNTFLGLDDAGLQPDLPSLIPPPQKTFPDNLLPYLHPFYRAELEGLANRLSRHAGNWIDAFNAVVPPKAAPPVALEDIPLANNPSAE